MSETNSRLQAEFGEAVEVRAAQQGDALGSLMPQLVAAPRDENAARELVAYCGREKLAVVVRGGGTKWQLGAVPQAFEVLLSTEHLTAVHDHDEGNATVNAGAGITVAALDATMGERGQFLAIDGQGRGATLGGVVAANANGAAALKYGRPRDQVVGLSAVLSDGRHVVAGSKVVKNVSGYDLNKLFIGSYGSLGLITRVTIRLRPHDACHAAWGAHYAGWREACEAAMAIVDGPFAPTSLRLHWRSSGGAFLQAQFDGVAASVEAQLARLPKTATGGQFATDEGASSASKATLEAAVLLRRAPQWMECAEAAGATALLCDCGLGRICADFASLPEVDGLRQTAREAGGTMVVSRAEEHEKTADLVWGPSDAATSLRRNLKARYDAAGIFSVGRGPGAV